MQSGVTPRLLNVNRFKRRINRQDPVANIYRNAIDLNRFSNGVARQIVRDYNNIILSAVADLKAIDLGEATAGAGIVSPQSVQAQRLRVILAQLKQSLDAWSGRSTAYVARELQGLAELQTEFITEQLKLAIEGGQVGARGIEPSVVAQRVVNTVEVAPNFAATVATVDPTDVSLVVPLSNARVLGAIPGQVPTTVTFNLTAAEGATLTLPNGQIIEKVFRGLAESQAQRFNTIVRTGLLTGEPTPQIARRLVGNLNFGQLAKTARQQALAGGELTKAADHQVLTLVRTSVQQVANAASEQVYKTNQDVTQKYRYVATLDSRTSAICASLDGKEFEYGKGPQPPIHFNCRSTTVPIVDYEGLGLTPPEKVIGIGKRASAEGPVPANVTYGKWLQGQSKDYQEKVFRSDRRAAYFRKLSNKYGPQDALVRMVREDGSEVTLAQLQRSYGKVRVD
jgi:SPP1 gp7 family putative phage head morphogenesis protein